MKTLNKLLKELAEVFASKEEDGWWGHDTNIGECKKEFKEIELKIKDLILEKFDGCVYHKDDIIKIVREL